MNRTSLVLCLMMTGALFTIPAHAQTPTQSAQDILKKVQDQTYLPKEAGLKDISFSIKNSMMAMMGDVDIHYYWKAPDKEKVVFSNIEDNPMFPPQAQAQATEGMKKIGRLCVGEGIADTLKGYDLTMGKDGDLTTLTGKSSDPEKTFTEVTYWINSDNVIVKQKGTFSKPQRGQTGSEQTLKSEKRNGKSYLVGSEQTDGSKRTLEWAEVDGIFLPTKFTVNIPASPEPIVIEFADVKVNKGVDDSVFTDAPAKAAGAPGDKGKPAAPAPDKKPL